MDLNQVQQDNFEAFISDNIDIVLADNEEWKCICPFCNGGMKNRQTFDINIPRGVAQCWRKNNCGWNGSAQSLIMDVLSVGFLESQEILNRGQNGLDGALRNLTGRVRTRKVYDDMGGFYESGGEVPLAETEFEDDVEEWISTERNFDYKWFSEKYEVMIPDQIGIHRNKLAIRVVTEDIEAYQLYHFRDKQMGPKTINPPDKILSKTLFNFHNLDFSRDGPLLITEGIFDAVRMESYGLNAVAIFGTYLQGVQLAIIDSLPIEEVCLCLDYGVEDWIINANIEKLKSVTDKKISRIVFDEPWQDPDEFGLDQELFMYYYENRVFEKNNLVQLLNGVF